MKNLILEKLRKSWTVSERDTGEYHTLTGNGMNYTISAYRIAGLGSMSMIEMDAMAGMMRMESFILTAEEKDLPLFNSDFIAAADNFTLLNEFYDTMIVPLAPQMIAKYRAVKERFSEFPPYKTDPRWYDSIRYDFSFGGTGRNLKEMRDEIILAYMDAYLENTAIAPKTDPVVKRAKTQQYVDGLFSNGGAAVDHFKKLFGEEAAHEIFERFVFSTRD